MPWVSAVFSWIMLHNLANRMLQSWQIATCFIFSRGSRRTKKTIQDTYFRSVHVFHGFGLNSLCDGLHSSDRTRCWRQSCSWTSLLWTRWLPAFQDGMSQLKCWREWVAWIESARALSRSSDVPQKLTRRPWVKEYIILWLKKAVRLSLPLYSADSSY